MTRTRARFGGLVSAVLLVLCEAVSLAQTGGLKGTVTTSTGVVVPGAFIVATRSGASQTTASGSDGSFEFTGLTSGSYRICIQVLQGSLLDPCQWSSAPATTVSAGQIASVGTIQVVAGQRLFVTLLDDVGALAANAGAGKTSGAHILVGVWYSGSFHPMRLRSKSSSGWNLDLVVPTSVPLSLTVSSTDFTMTDSQGNNVNRSTGASAVVQLVAGSNPTPYLFHVVGFSNNGH